MHLIFYGPEGSGKGTQAKLLGELLGLPIYTTGDLVRVSAQNDKSPLGDMCRKVLSEGKYLPDEDVNKLIERKITTSEAKKGFILDGFPRTIGQAKFLDEITKKERFGLDRLIYLKLSDEQSIQRLAKRKRVLFGSSKILHDDPIRVKQRLEVYHKNEKEVLEFYKKKNLVLEINANQKIEEVFRDIVTGLHLQ